MRECLSLDVYTGHKNCFLMYWNENESEYIPSHELCTTADRPSTTSALPVDVTRKRGTVTRISGRPSTAVAAVVPGFYYCALPSDRRRRETATASFLPMTA